MARFILCALVAGATFVGGWLGAARADSVRYDPEACSTDAHDRVFVRLQSGVEFALPADDLLSLGGPPVEGPARAFEPEGCPLNPIMTASAAIAYRPSGQPVPGEPEEARWHPELLQIFGHNGPVRVQDIVLRVFDRCAMDPGNVVKRISPVLEECRLHQQGVPDKEWKSFIRALPKMHPEFGGRRFAALCYSAYHPGAGRSCRTGYQLEDGLSVSYRFHDDQISRAAIAGFDLEVRAFVLSRRASTPTK
jgi:hypothetical protein